jgi:hypothetical protein
LRERQDRPRGGPGAPLTRAEVEAKFRGNAALALSPSGVDGVILGIDGLVTRAPLTDLLASLTAERK